MVANFAEPTDAELAQLDQLFRANIKNSEEENETIKELMQKTELLLAMTKANEAEASVRVSSTRDSHSRSAMDMDGAADSPGPSPAENKQIKKLSAGRPSSQPPRDKEKDADDRSEHNSATGKTKVTFALNQEVAFKPKIANSTEEHDWIQGIVVKVIGQDKSRRYDVKDPYPEDTSKGIVVYRSSASSMVPIPPIGAHMPPYEAGKQVLALFPDTTSFYRAEVVSMMENDTKVHLRFEEDDLTPRIADRRFVLDHKG